MVWDPLGFPLLVEYRSKIIKESSLFLFSVGAASFVLVTFETIFALNIVNAPLFWVNEHFVSVGNLLELFFCGVWVVRVLVWMVQDRLFFECFFYVI